MRRPCRVTTVACLTSVPVKQTCSAAIGRQTRFKRARKLASDQLGQVRPFLHGQLYPPGDGTSRLPSQGIVVGGQGPNRFLDGRFVLSSILSERSVVALRTPLAARGPLRNRHEMSRATCRAPAAPVCRNCTRSVCGGGSGTRYRVSRPCRGQSKSGQSRTAAEQCYWTIFQVLSACLQARPMAFSSRPSMVTVVSYSRQFWLDAVW